MDIVWHRQDLRISDNTALHKSDDDVLPLYIFDDRLIEMVSPRRLEWIIRNVKQLRKDYRDMGSDILIRKGNSVDIIPDVVEEFGANKVLWNKGYSKVSRSRDRKVEDRLSNYNSFHDKVMHSPDEIFTNKGDPYSVFTYYHRKWVDRDKSQPYDEPKPENLYSFTDDVQVPEMSDFGLDTPDLEYPDAGTSAARSKLSEFINNKIGVYKEERDSPYDRSTSRLSPYMSYGVIGVREVWDETQNAKNKADTDSVEEFQKQIAWRDFYTQVLYHNPEVVTENYKDYENEIQWSSNEEHLQRWKEGKTGYPIVDAGMRQLIQEGRMHNRLRMIVASFLTKDLLIDWREGYKWFRKMLIDHDTANNNGGWQWAASTGTDAQPYFRIFNPMTQGERYDPDAKYIKKYVPELTEVASENVHSWNEIQKSEREKLAPEYYHPIVDHSEMREEAIDMYKQARGEE